MNHPNIIRKLGGAKAVGDELRARGVNVEDVTVRSWTLAGRAIPAKYWLHIAEIAKVKHINVSFEALARSVAA